MLCYEGIIVMVAYIGGQKNNNLLPKKYSDDRFQLSYE